MTKLTYWKEGPTQELPNQLVLQTGHRNTLAESVPWTLSSTNVESDLLLRLANSTSLVPTWHGAPSQVNHCMPKDSPNQPPTIIYKTAAKEIDRPRSQGQTHLEGNLGLKLTKIQFNVGHCPLMYRRWPKENEHGSHHWYGDRRWPRLRWPLPVWKWAVAYA